MINIKRHFLGLVIGLATSAVVFAEQVVPVDVVDFQQYDSYQKYLNHKAKYKAFAVSENMQPGSAYGWGNSQAEAEQYALDTCKKRFRWGCTVVSLNGKVIGKTRSIPSNIKPVEIAVPDLSAQSEDVKGLFDDRVFTKYYAVAKGNKAFATNKFKRSGYGHGKGYITEEIAIEKAMYHCELAVSLTRVTNEKAACILVAVNDRLLPDNIAQVLQQQSLKATDN